MPLLETFTSPPPEEPDDPWTVEIGGTYGKLQTAKSTGRSTEYQAGAVISYLQLLFDDQADKSHTRFLTLVNDPDRLVRLDLLVDVMHSSVKALTGRPTGPATSSLAGQSETETGSTPESPPSDETPEPLPSAKSSTGSSSSSSKQPRKRAPKQTKS